MAIFVMIETVILTIIGRKSFKDVSILEILRCAQNDSLCAKDYTYSACTYSGYPIRKML